MLPVRERILLAMGALLVIGLGFGAPAALANSIAIDTFAPGSSPANGEDWQVTRDGGGYSGNVVNVDSGSIPGTWVTPSTINSTQDAVVGDPGGHIGQWVSTDSSGGTGNGDVNGQEYTYTDSFTLGDFAGSGLIQISGTISSDNWIPTPSSPAIPGGLFDPTGVTLTFGAQDYPVTLTGGPDLGQESMYQYAFNIQLTNVFTSPTGFTLKVNVVNSYEDPTNGENPGPTGLILAGTATATSLGGQEVPLPSTGSAGLVLLGCIGGFAAIRRRVMA